MTTKVEHGYNGHGFNTLFKASEISYIRGANWTQFEDVVIFADTGQKFGFNRLMLDSLSPLLKNLLFSLYECPLANLDEIVYFSTDYTEKELDTLRNVMLSGQTLAFKPDLASSFEGIGLDLNDIPKSFQASLKVTGFKCDIKDSIRTEQAGLATNPFFKLAALCKENH